MDFLQIIDEKLFYFINVTCSNSLFDKVMPFVTARENWFMFYIIMGLYLLIKGGKKGIIVVILCILLVTLTDQLNSFVFKQFIHRVRPCNVLPAVHLLVNCTDSFSFPSSHAVNNFAAATLLSHFYKNMKIPLFFAAAVVALSRVFVGVHYPFDVIGGAAIGMIIALLLIYLFEFLASKIPLLQLKHSKAKPAK